jgi:hypothetical protein
VSFTFNNNTTQEEIAESAFIMHIEIHFQSLSMVNEQHVLSAPHTSVSSFIVPQELYSELAWLQMVSIGVYDCTTKSIVGPAAPL